MVSGMDLYEYYTFILIMIAEVFTIMLVAYIYKKTNKSVINDRCAISWKNVLKATVVFSIIGIITTEYLTISIENGILINIRDFPVMFAGMLGGPMVGIPTGIVVGVEGFLSGGTTAVPSMLGTIIAGALGGLLWYFSGKKFPTVLNAVILIFATETINMCLIALFIDDGYDIISIIGPVMIIGNTICMVVASYIYHKYILEDKEKII